MENTCPLLSGLATRVKDVDGRLLGKDSKPLNAYRCVQLEEPTITPDDAPTGQHVTVHLSELRNDECVSGADVSIPLASVDELRRNTYARALIEVSSTSALVDSLIVAILFQNGSGQDYVPGESVNSPISECSKDGKHGLVPQGQKALNHDITLTPCPPRQKVSAERQIRHNKG
ncbi:hypothetical protein Tco_0051854 [Tanacetum coccineum]